ncbi:MAG: BsuPI-related putative proteinase inhibitor [Armatimonadota bacterium]
MYKIIFFASILMTLFISASIMVESGQERMDVPKILQEILLEKESFEIQKEIQAEYAIKNISNKPITYTFNSSKQFDAWVMKVDKEIYRYSDNKAFLTVITNLTLQPNEIKKFKFSWDQKDKAGKDVGPGSYTIYAQLTPSEKKLQPEPTKKNITIGLGTSDASKISIREAIEQFSTYEKKKVIIEAKYTGWRPDKDDPNISDGPPETRSDWTIADDTGAMYVTGNNILDPTEDKGKKISVLGILKKTDKGKVYIKAEKVTLISEKAR